MLISGRPKIVVTIHGVRTHGKWQKAITPFLAKYGLIPYHIDYGWFGAVGFYIPWLRERKIRAVRDELRRLVGGSDARRVSVIAHSFGTYIALTALRDERGALLYDRVVLTGSILPCDFPWDVVFQQKWALAAKNVRADADWVVSLADWLYHNLNWRFRYPVGKSGREKFEQNSAVLLDDELCGDHSVAHNELRFEQWARFIAYPNLPDDIAEKIQAEMQVMRQRAAMVLAVPVEDVRASMFVPWDGALRPLPEVSDNVTHAPEYGLEIQPGHGTIGVAFERGQPMTVIKAGDSWGEHPLPGSEIEKLDPRLGWALSFPLRSDALGMLAVVNIDGLGDPPQIVTGENSDALALAAFRIFTPFLAVGRRCLETAFRGEKPERPEV
jgi:pimeloyl-ACP methyl ester carboxylesterase